MHKLTRLYVTNAGYKLAWYEGVLLEFTDADTKEPTHTIASLVNQGGKTTLLSLVFSTFDTRKDRFLQHLSNKAQRFEQYFDDEGLPGIIAAEWQVPSADLLSPVTTLVTGQIVVRHNADDMDPERTFFIFTCGGKLSLDSIPGHGLEAGKKGTLRNREQVNQWLAKMESAYPGRFQHTAHQGDWLKLLEGAGLDVDMLRHQVDFNKREGAMDESFLDFKSEQEFVQRFLTLAMDGGPADAIREAIAAHCGRLAKKRPYEVQRDQLALLDGVFMAFARGAIDDRAAAKALADANSDVAVACATLIAQAGARREKADADRFFAEEQDALEESQRRTRVAAANDAAGVEQEILRRDLAEAQKRIDSATETVETAEREEREYVAAQMLERRQQLMRSVQDLDDAIERAAEGVRPYRAKLKNITNVLRVSLTQTLSEHEVAVKSSESAVKAIAAAADQLAKDEQALGKRELATNGELSQIGVHLENANKTRRELEQDGLLQVGLAASVGEARLREAVRAAEEKTREASDRAEALGEEEQAALVDQATQLDTKVRQEVQAKQIEADAQNAQELYESLRGNRILARGVSADYADPDSEGVRPALLKLIENARTERTEIELERQRYHEAIQSIDATGLAGRDADVTQVIRHLANAGVSGVRSHAGYLAEVLPDARKARAVALSDPGRFLGVSVPNDAQFAKATAALAHSAAPINRPVVVSVASDQPDPPRTPHLVVGPTSDALYNRDAARESLPELERLREQADVAHKDVDSRITDAQAAQGQLERYHREVGTGGVERLKLQARHARAAAEEAERARVRAGERAAAARAARKVANQEASDHRQEAQRRLAQAERVHRFETQFGAKVAQWEAERTKLAAELQRIEKRREALADARRQRDAERYEHEEIRMRSGHEAQKVRDELTPLGGPLEDADIRASLHAEPRSLDVLRGDHKLARESLERIEQEKTGELKVERDGFQRTLDSGKAEFDEAMRGLDERIVRRRIGSKYSRCVAECKQLREAALQERQAADSARVLAENSIKTLDKRIKEEKLQPLVLPQVAEFTLARLEEELQKAHERSEKAALIGERAREAASKARALAQAAANDAVLYDGQAKLLRAVVPDGELPAPDIARFTTTESVSDSCAKRMRARSDAERAHSAARRRVEAAYENVRRVARSDAFMAAEPSIGFMLTDNQLEATIRDYERIENAIKDRLATVSSELATMDHDFERATERLAELVKTATTLLKRACDNMSLPENVPVVGGQPVLKMNRKVLLMSQEDRKAALRSYMDSLAAGGNIPESGAALATAALMKLGGRLGLCILKMVESADEQYVPVDHLSHSGAERISMALLLYFVIARLRYEERASIKRVQGGVLLLDNPFAKATARPIWQVILGLADATGVQLVFTTGIKEYETLSVFRRFVRLAKRDYNPGTGRYHVGVVDFNFRPGEAA